jgi:MFS family permease
MASIHTYQALLVFRFVLGCIEAGFFPGVLYLLSCWYTPTEIGKRFAVFLSAAVLAGAFGGLLAGAITGHLAGALRIDAWRWLFLIEGAATVVAAIVAKFILLDFPSTSLALSPEEAQLATIRLLAAGVESSSHDPANRLTHWQAFKAAALDYRTYLFMLLHVCEVGASTIHYFIPTITITLGYETVTAQYMTIPIYLVATICLNIAAFSGDRLHERRWHVTGAMAFGCITALVCVFNNNPVVRYVMLCFVYSGTWMAIPHVLAWTSETINMPAEKRSISLAIVNAVGNLSTVYGSTIWPSSTGPRYTFGWSVTAAFLASGAIIAALVPVILKASPHHVTKAERELQNKKKALGIQA